MKLLIDLREPQSIIKYINALNSLSKEKLVIELKNLDIGDYILYDEKEEKNIIIIERKSLSDLESSIKDGRYNEQSFRLSECPIHNHNIIYLIEGNIINHRNHNFKNTLYSSLFSLNYFKGFSVFNSVNNVETGEIIYNFASKLMREKLKPGFYCDLSNVWVDKDKQLYTAAIKTSKKSYINEDNIMEIMIMQIPGISHQTSKTICNSYKTMNNLIKNLETHPNCLDSLKLENSNRKINKTSIDNIKKYLLRIENS